MEIDYYQKFSDLSDVQLLKAINEFGGYTEEAKPHLKKVALERKLIDEDFNYLTENSDEETKEFYETVICTISLQKLANLVPLKIRFYHLLVDYIGLYIFAIFASVLLTYLGYGGFIQALPEKILGILLYFGYFFFMELMYGKTLGKFITKTKVVDYQKQKPTTNQIFIRSISRLIPFEPFSFFGKRPVGWHDSFSRTYVIYEE